MTDSAPAARARSWRTVRMVALAMVALVIAEAVVEKFGGDSIPETRRNLQGYLAALAPLPQPDDVDPQRAAAPMGNPLQ